MYFLIIFLFFTLHTSQTEVSCCQQEGFEILESLELSEIFKREKMCPGFTERKLKNFRFRLKLSTITEKEQEENHYEPDCHYDNKILKINIDNFYKKKYQKKSRYNYYLFSVDHDKQKNKAEQTHLTGNFLYSSKTPTKNFFDDRDDNSGTSESPTLTPSSSDNPSFESHFTISRDSKDSDNSESKHYNYATTKMVANDNLSQKERNTTFSLPTDTSTNGVKALEAKEVEEAPRSEHEVLKDSMHDRSFLLYEDNDLKKKYTGCWNSIRSIFFKAKRPR